MLNTYTVWNKYWKTLGISEQDLFYHSMDKYIDNRYEMEKDDFLVMKAKIKIL